jgi:hypothetical protein
MSKRKESSSENPKGKKIKKKTQDSDEEIVIENSQPETTSDIEAGIIESIRLDNFMCHTCLEIDLHPNVNIINGENGSKIFHVF